MSRRGILGMPVRKRRFRDAAFGQRQALCDAKHTPKIAALDERVKQMNALRNLLAERAA